LIGPGGTRRVLAQPPIGRGDDLAAIDVFLDQVAAGGGVLLLSGEPGVGKTVMLEAAAEAAAASGMRVLRASGAEFEADLGFSGLHQICLPLQDELGQLDPADRDALSVVLGLSVGMPSDRLAVSRAVLALFRRAATTHPVVVIVDDLPWLDRPSAVVLGLAARRLDGSRTGLLAASRSGAESFFERGGLPARELAPLSSASARQLLATRYPHLPGRVQAQLIEQARGNPLALLELPIALSERRHADAQALPAVPPLTQRLRELFAARAGELPEPTRRLLLLAALEGTGDLGIVQRAARGQREVEDLAPAEQTGLVHIDEASGQLVFRHPLTRAAVVELSSAEERRVAHQALGEVLAGHPERCSWHLAEAAVRPDERVADMLEDAALRMLRRGDGGGAVTSLLRAADLSPKTADRSRRMAQAAYLGADVNGDLRSVFRLLADPRLPDARREDPGLRGSLHAAVAAAYAQLNGEGDVFTAHRLLVGAIETSAHCYDAGDPVLMETLLVLLSVCLWAERPEAWEPYYAALARLTPRVPPIVYLETQLIADPARTATPEALDQLDAVIAGLAGETDLVLIERIARAGTYVDRVPMCREALWRVVDSGRQGGAVATAINALMHLCVDAVFAGRWEESLRLAEEGLAFCSAHDYRLPVWPFRLGQALIAAARGETDRTHALADEMIRWAAPRGIGGVELFARHARTLAAMGRGDFEDAYQQVTLISPAGTLPSHIAYALWVLMDVVEAAVRTGRNDEAAAHVAAMSQAGVAAISPRLAAVTAASAAIATPDADLAAAAFEEALAVPGAARWPFERARIHLVYGERLRRARAAVQARQHLLAARGILEELGARPWVIRADNELRATGLGAPRASGTGPSALTAQEREVAALAAAGLSNKQIGERLFLSPRTVSAHLYRVFPKLGITSRAALYDALASQGARDAEQPDRDNR
jgi:DNA-binding CsgD family transcriptional regulator